MPLREKFGTVKSLESGADQENSKLGTLQRKGTSDTTQAQGSTDLTRSRERSCHLWGALFGAVSSILASLALALFHTFYQLRKQLYASESD